jgi:hypothetical protein
LSTLALLLLLAADEHKAARAIELVAASGRVVEQGLSESERVAPRRLLAPGPPPLLQFRYLEGNLRHRFGDSALVVDDAGH